MKAKKSWKWMVDKKALLKYLRKKHACLVSRTELSKLIGEQKLTAGTLWGLIYKGRRCVLLDYITNGQGHQVPDSTVTGWAFDDAFYCNYAWKDLPSSYKKLMSEQGIIYRG